MYPSRAGRMNDGPGAMLELLVRERVTGGQGVPTQWTKVVDLPELATAAQEKIKVNVAIINNQFLGMVRQWQEFFYDKRYAATPLTSPDFVKLAEAFGLKGVRV